MRGNICRSGLTLIY